MKILKDDKYQFILQAARAEFISKGFKNSSMRNVARNADVGLSNIYNYFKNKDEIFSVIVMPAKKDLFRFITRQHTEEGVDFNSMSALGHSEDAIEEYIDLIYKYKEEYRLLLYQSEGSSFSNFRDSLTDHMTQISYTYMELIKKYHPNANEVSCFFFHTLASWMTSILGEIVTHDLSRKKIRIFFDEYFRYGTAGWRELIGI